jgi:histidinol-phosphate aminotransferase
MERMIIMDRNENNYGPSPRCYDVVKNLTMDYFSTYSRDYPRRIKSKISETYGVSPDRVLLGYGAEDLLKQVVYWAASAKGTTIAVPDKSWWYYKHIVAETGGRMVEYHMVEGEDGWDFDDAEVLRLLREERPRVFMMASPNNPTGNFLAPERIKAYIAAKSPETVFVLDEAYWGFGAPAMPEAEIGEMPGVVVLRTLSKYYALAGIRIGFAFMGTGLEDLATYNAKYLGFNRVSEELLFAALDPESRDYYRRTAAAIVEDGAMFFRELKAMGFKPFRTCANFILARLPEKDFEYLRDELQKKGLVIKFFTEQVFKNCVRISIGTSEENKLLVDVMKDLMSRKRA